MALRCFLQAKIHGVKITQANPGYMGSIAVCPDLLRASGILPNEKVDVYNLDNGNRLSTYVIMGETGQIGLNGAAALKGKQGERVIIVSYTWLEGHEVQEHKPRLVFADQENNILRSEP